ncbi:OmpA family protein [Ruania alba]|uniref:Outer membrane protein OmpA n=1 Tax=Ruania alba TaxID=648782 RepID=A0A1H5M5H1_9MICO|nr:OmpA family protein [Ruania alba]SEE84444.1 Outer membrane protein OmpA [Ruania alba]
MKKLAVQALAACLLLAACTSEPDEPTGTDQTGAGEHEDAESVDPEASVAQVEIGLGPATVTADVLPLERTDAGLVLTLDMTADDPAEVTDRGIVRALRAPWASRSGTSFQDWVGLRLLDLPDEEAVAPALDASDETIFVSAENADGSERLQVLYGDPGADALTLFVPQGGLVEDIPVIDAEVPAAGGDEELPIDDVASADVASLSEFSVDMVTTTRTERSDQSLTIALGSDVLFDVDSAELTDDALAVIETAAADVQEREPGPVQVIGHTDNRDSDAHNQDLSERRAAAVAETLEDLIDTEVYPLEVSGRGETEPVADNSSSSGRAANRRVELVVETPASAEVVEATEPIEFEGLEATGAEGIEWEVGNRSFLIQAPTARIVDDHLVVELHTTATDDAVDSVAGPAVYQGTFAGPAGLDTLRTMAGVAVMNGSTATIPALHGASPAQPDAVVPLTDLATFSRLDGGDTRTSVLIYPAGLAVQDTVTVQLVNPHDEAWRLTDIAIE